MLPSALPESALFGSFQTDWPAEAQDDARGHATRKTAEELEVEREEAERAEAMDFLIDEMSGWAESAPGKSRAAEIPAAHGKVSQDCFTWISTRRCLSSNQPTLVSRPSLPPPAGPANAFAPSAPGPSTRRPVRVNAQTTPPVAFLQPANMGDLPRISSPSRSRSGSCSGPSSLAAPILRPDPSRTLTDVPVRPRMSRMRSGSLVNADVPTPSLLAAGRVVANRPSRPTGPDQLRIHCARRTQSSAGTFSTV